MANETICVSSAMEGKGAYNRHATLQAEGVALVLPHLERAVADMVFDSPVRPIVIAIMDHLRGRIRSLR